MADDIKKIIEEATEGLRKDIKEVGDKTEGLRKDIGEVGVKVEAIKVTVEGIKHDLKQLGFPS